MTCWLHSPLLGNSVPNAWIQVMWQCSFLWWEGITVHIRRYNTYSKYDCDLHVHVLQHLCVYMCIVLHLHCSLHHTPLVTCSFFHPCRWYGCWWDLPLDSTQGQGSSTRTHTVSWPQTAVAFLQHTGVTFPNWYLYMVVLNNIRLALHNHTMVMAYCCVL